MAKTIHRKKQGEQRTYRVVPATDATGRDVGRHAFKITEDGPEYVGEGNARADWEPDQELTNDDAPQSALDAVFENGEN